MSRNIDIDAGPLSPEDITYLRARDRYVEIAANASAHGTELDEDTMESLRVRGLSVVRPEGAAEGSGTSEGTPKPEGDKTPDSGEGSGPEPLSDEWFDSATVDQLKEELRKRELPVSGTKQELIDRLYETTFEEDEDETS